MSKEPGNKPIVILGRVGHGKSTFIRYIRYKKATEELKNYIQVTVNFVDSNDSETNVPIYIYDEIEKQLNEVYGYDIRADNNVRAALNAEINRFKNSFEGKYYKEDTDEYRAEEFSHIKKIIADSDLFFKKHLDHLSGSQRKSVVVFIDNIDKQSDKMQEEAYKFASKMSRTWSVLVFVSLRPGTFYRSINKGILDSIDPVCFTVNSPDVAYLLSKRLAYARLIAEGKSDSLHTNSREISLDSPSVMSIIDCFIASVKWDKNLIPLLESVCNGDIRKLLRDVREILTGQHLNTREILEAYQKNPDYKIPVHHIQRALLYGDSIHFTSEKSSFLNLFDIEDSRTELHFLRILILDFVAKFTKQHHEKRYCPVSELRSYLASLGYFNRDIESNIEYLFEKNCIESEVPDEAPKSQENKVRSTPCGDFHIKELVYNFSYIDAIIIDTPILCDSTRQELTDHYLKSPNYIFSRLTRAGKFISYLNQCAVNTREDKIIQVWESIKKSLNANIEKVEHSAKRNLK